MKWLSKWCKLYVLDLYQDKIPRNVYLDIYCLLREGVKKKENKVVILSDNCRLSWSISSNEKSVKNIKNLKSWFKCSFILKISGIWRSQWLFQLWISYFKHKFLLIQLFTICKLLYEYSITIRPSKTRHYEYEWYYLDWTIQIIWIFAPTLQ